MDAPNVDTARMPPGGLHLLSRERLEEDNVSMNVAPLVTRRIFRASAGFSLLVLVGVGAALAWRSYGDQTTDMLRAFAPPRADLLSPASSSKPAAPPIAAAEIQQQLTSITLNLAAVKHTVEQLTANENQLTRTQGQIAQSIATLQTAEQQLSQKLSSAPAHMPVNVPLPLPRPVQHPAQLSTGGSSKPVRVPQPQSLQPRLYSPATKLIW